MGEPAAGPGGEAKATGARYLLTFQVQVEDPGRAVRWAEEGCMARFGVPLRVRLGEAWRGRELEAAAYWAVLGGSPPVAGVEMGEAVGALRRDHGGLSVEVEVAVTVRDPAGLLSEAGGGVDRASKRSVEGALWEALWGRREAWLRAGDGLTVVAHEVRAVDADYWVSIRFGSEPVVDDQDESVPPEEFHFATEAELRAFLEGVEAMAGWLAYEVVEERWQGRLAGDRG
jgi:hypothetical protein